MASLKAASLAALSLAVGLGIGCSEADPAARPPGVVSAPVEVPARTAETERMVERLHKIAHGPDSMRNPFNNALLLDRLRRAPRPRQLEARVEAELDLALQLLRAGESKEAAARFEALLERVELLQDTGLLDESRLLDEAGARSARSATGAQRRREIRLLVALSHLRIAEQENCVLHHQAQSCLVPIRAGGLHHRPEASRRAMELYGELLDEMPDDPAARWLYNLAAMTLGLYPDGIPEAWRIDPAVFASEADVPATDDVAPRVGADVTGLAGGVVFDDLDGDGHLDLLVSSWGADDPLVFLRNDGSGRFEDRSTEAGLEGLTGGLNLTHADVDGDGDLDVLVLRGAWLGALGRQPPSLLRNRGDATFDDVTESAGLLTFAPSQAAAWADVDLDGDLDLFVGNESTRRLNRRSELYLNRGDGTFEEVAPRVGLVVDAFVKGCAWGDVDNDGRPDLYVSTMGSRNLLFRNVAPEPSASGGSSGLRFEEIGESAGVAEPLNGFPTWFWDYDNDGWLDLFAASYGTSFMAPVTEQVAADYLGTEEASRPWLYRNQGDGSFRDVTEESGLSRGLMAMGANYGDLDNDGFPDVYVGTGAPNFGALAPNRAFLNVAGRDVVGRKVAGRRFADVTTAAGMGHIQKGHGVAFGDWDGDGDQDIYAVMGGAFSGDTFPNALFENSTQQVAPRRWLTLRLEGTRANRFAVGARVRVRVDTAEGPRTVHALVGTGGSFGSSSLQLEVGLGEARRLLDIEVDWPSTTGTQRFDGPSGADDGLDRVYRLREGDSASVVERSPRGEVSVPPA
ncbi:MAG: VCBS repeat-containing protein [Acidobacteriota bacterium]